MSNALGRVDGEGSVSRAEVLENCRVIAQATDLPVNADLENVYADDPKEAATILRDAAEVGIVGGSIEDWSGERIYEFNHAVERVAAGAEMAGSLPVPFTFVARAENLIRGRLDLDDTIKRLQAFEKAGADVLYARGSAKPANGCAPRSSSSNSALICRRGAFGNDVVGDLIGMG